MKDHQFVIGDRVMATGVIDDNDLTNKCGVIINITDNGRLDYGVQFDERITGGHDCNSTGLSGYCWYCDPSLLEFIKSDDDEKYDKESNELLDFLYAFAPSQSN